MHRRVLVLVVGAAAALTIAGCGSGGSDTLTVYSGREEELVAPLIDQFEQETGTDVEVRYGESAELAATIAEEGDGSPADVFFAQDPGSLGAVAGEGLLAALPHPALDRVPERFRDPEGRWVGTSGRSRVIAYNTDELSEDEVPDSVFDLTDPRWKGRVGVAPTNASFQAFITAMRLQQGEEKTRAWLEDLKANGVRLYERNTPIVEAVASGEIDLGLVNHYYLYLVREEQPGAPSPTTSCPETTPARSSAPPGPACSRVPTAARTPRRSWSSCSPTRARGSTRSAQRRLSTRS